jgi:DNA polymerase-1
MNTIFHLTFGDQEGHRNKRVALLVPAKDLKQEKLEEYYIRPLAKSGIDERDVIALNLMHRKGNKISATDGRAHLENIFPLLEALGVELIICTDASYFKFLTKVPKPTATLGYRTPTMWEDIDSFYVPSLGAIFYNPDVAKNIELGLAAVSASYQGQATELEKLSLDELVELPNDTQEIQEALKKLYYYPSLAVDIETFSLKVGEAGIASISFSHSEGMAVAFPVDMQDELSADQVRRKLRFFFKRYVAQGGRLKFHNAPFDVKMLIWELFMKDVDDIQGMREGLDLFFSALDDTKILAYLALNNTAKADLSLKSLAFEFAGNYAIDEIKDVRKVPLRKLLVYNGVDTMATCFVFNKYRKQVQAEQEDVYQNVFLPSLKTITMMELTGMPLNLNKVLQAEIEMERVRDDALIAVKQTPLIESFTWKLREDEATKANAKLKKLRKTKDDFLNFEFNPNSDVQLRKLLYDRLDMPINHTTDNGNPSVSAQALKEMVAFFQRDNLTQEETETRTLIEAIVDLHEVSTILSTFIPAFKDKSLSKKGWTYLLGNFNLGGTVSGRLSSSKPNLQNIPSTGTKYAKIIKKCFQAPKGWLFVGADYASLEDRISALQTKDPNKLKVYTDGYDGHCLRAFSYFADRMPDVVAEIQNMSPHESEPMIINSIKHRYPELRQLSKGPTFALTYMGTWKTLVETFGLTKAEAKMIEANYHRLYKVSDDWVQAQLRTAQTTGYVELAFGLRLRTPMLPKVVLGQHSTMPWEAYSEVKTAANALGQSYGLINSYSGNMFMERVWDSKYANDILPIAQIHDSQYYMIRNHLGCLKWVNDNLVECMEWNDLDAIRHDEVGLGAELEVYWPSWADPIEIPNRVSLKQLRELLDDVQPPPIN